MNLSMYTTGSASNISEQETEQMLMVEKTMAVYKREFGSPMLCYRSPGRINVLGEHTDYNEGFVLPAAIDKAVYLATGPRIDNQIHLYASAYQEKFITDLESVRITECRWANYILGVVAQLQKAGFKPGGFNMVIDSDLPVGAGLSSSAALECAALGGLVEMFALELDAMAIVKMAQKAEHEFARVQCGIMDQFASVFGKKDQLIKLDCRSLDFEYIPFPQGQIRLVLLNSNVKHNLAATAYNQRRVECETGVAMVAGHLPEVRSLRDVSQDMLDEFVKAQDPLVYRRCSYVVSENARLLEACEDLRKNNLRALGNKMFTTHWQLSRDYEVSCPELDFLAGFAAEFGIAGARMMGGGFGGCTINLVEESNIEKFIADAAQAYEKSMSKKLTAYIVRTGDGLGRIDF